MTSRDEMGASGQSELKILGVVVGRYEMLRVLYADFAALHIEADCAVAATVDLPSSVLFFQNRVSSVLQLFNDFTRLQRTKPLCICERFFFCVEELNVFNACFISRATVVSSDGAVFFFRRRWEWIV